MGHLHDVHIRLSPLELVDQTLELGESVGTGLSLEGGLEDVILEHFDGLVFSRSLGLKRIHISERSEASDFMELGTEIKGKFARVRRAYVFLGVSVS